MTAPEAVRTLRPVKIFLVEDSALLRSRLESMISAIPGAQAIAHADGAEEAIRQILATRPDAVVLDLHLKQGSGFDILRAVAKAAPEIAFYVLTNFPEEGYRRTAERLGARGFFDKSTEVEGLRQALMQISS